MKKILFSIAALIASASISAQTVQLFKGETLVKEYTQDEVDRVVFKEAQEIVNPIDESKYHYDLYLTVGKHGGMSSKNTTLVRSIDGLDASKGVITITGIGEVLREHNPDIEIWAAEPENAAILAGGSIGTHVQMGIGDGLIPDILNTGVYDNTCIIPDDNALDMAKRLAREEGIMCGISSGTNVVAAIMLAEKLGPGKTVVTVLPDTAERYFSTPLFDD